MSNIRVRLNSRQEIQARLKPQQGIQVGEDKLYLYDPDLIDAEVELAREWAIKTDGLVETEDYSSKAWAIGGTGTETNNSKYYAGQASTSATNAATSEINASNSASTATTQAGIATTQAGIATTKAGEAASSASTATTQAGIATTQAGIATTKAGEASTSATNAYNSASQASTSATNAYNSAGQAATSATSASNYADQSKQWAIGVPTEPADGSAKYWAGQAQSAVESIGDATLTIQKNGSDLGTFTANATVDKTIDIPIPTAAADINALPDTTKYGATITASLNTTDYKLTLTLKDQDGNTLGTAQVIDFPIESVVVSGAYDSVNKKIVLTLQNGTTIDIPVGDLISGLQTEITSSNKLDADLVDDSTSTNKFVTASDITTWNGKQDTISDLSTIRTNASNGASAYTTIQGYGDIVTHDASEFATSAQGALADTALQSGDNISELVNDSGYITGITSSDVTTALGYTPYDSANPSGYITSSALAPYVLASSLATVATSGDYDDLINKPTIPAAQIQSDWTQSDNTKLDYIKNKPSLATVATSGSYNDLNNKPTIPAAQVNSDWNAISGVAQILNKPTIPTVNNSTITLTQGGVTKGSFTLNQATDASIDFDAGGGGGGSSRNIGEIVTSTIPLTDAGLHLLDGSLLLSGGSYDAFITYIAGLVSTYPSLFTTEASWQSAVSSNGVCGKFVYDSQNGTLRLPKYNSKIYSGEGTASVIGNGKNIGWTTGSTEYAGVGATYSGAGITGIFGNDETKTLPASGTGISYQPAANVMYGLSTNAEKSGVIADLSTITAALDGYWYIVVANSTKTEIEVDIDQVMTDLNGKADVDFSNVNSTGKETATYWGFPSDTYDDLTLGATGTEYTALYNGWFTLSKVTSGNGQFVAMENQTGLGFVTIGYGAYNGLRISMPCRKGDKVTVGYNAGGATYYFRFVRAVGG